MLVTFTSHLGSSNLNISFSTQSTCLNISFFDAVRPWWWVFGNTFVVSLFLSASSAWVGSPSIVPCSRERRSNLMLWVNRYSQEKTNILLEAFGSRTWNVNTLKDADQEQKQAASGNISSLSSCQQTCMQFVNLTQTDMSLEKILRSSGLVSMQSFRQLSRKLVWWQSTSSMFDAWRRKKTGGQRVKHKVTFFSERCVSYSHPPFSGCSPWCARWAPSPQTSCSTGCSAQSWACAVWGRTLQQTCVQIVWTECEDILLVEIFTLNYIKFKVLHQLTIWENVKSTAWNPCCWSTRCTAASRRVCSKTSVWTTSGTSSGLSWKRNANEILFLLNVLQQKTEYIM